MSRSFESLPERLKSRLVGEGKAPLDCSLDGIISLFLKKHDVFVEPPAGAPGVDVSDRLLFALAGPIAMVNAGIKNQSKAATLAEWTSWKQWALSHQDFNEFKQRMVNEIDKHNFEFSLWLDSSEATDEITRIEEELAEARRKASESYPSGIATLLFSLIFLACIGFGVQLFLTKHSTPKAADTHIVP
jgi:hypothetical protein